MKTKPNWLARNAANMITLSAFPICFVLLWVVIVHRNWTLTILFLVTAIFLTDFFDGRVARYFKTISSFGAAADRLRDKLVMGIMFAFLLLDGRIHITLKVLTVPLAVVEIALLMIWFAEVKKKTDASAGRSGKIKMFLMSAATLLMLLNLIIEERWGQEYHLLATVFLDSLFLISLFFAVKSYLGHRAKHRAQLSAQLGQA